MSTLKTVSNKERESFLDSLVERINEAAERETESARDTSGNHGEFVGSLGYGDGTLDLRELDDDVREIVERIPKKDRRRAILESSEVEHVESISCQTNSVFAVELGEIEGQFEDAIVKDLQTLTPEEIQYVTRRAECCIPERHFKGIPDLFYIDLSYEFMHLILSEVRLRAWCAANGVDLSESEE